jgi:hypothetical protein
MNWLRALPFLLAAACIASLQACATKPQAQYKVSFCNMEATPASEIRANYGGTQWELPTLPARPKDGDERCVGGYSVATMQALPETMALKWILSGRRVEATIPIKSRLNGTYPTSGLQVVFQNGRVEVFEYVYPANNHLVRLRIYPPVAPKPKPAPKSPIRVAGLHEHGAAPSEVPPALATRNATHKKESES